MKIVYLSGSLIPSRLANSIQTMKMCQAFAKNGHEVVLLAPDLSNCEPDILDIYQFYGVEAVFRVDKLKWFPIKGASYYYAILSALKAKNLKPDLVYGRFISGCFFCAMMGLPVITEFHSSIDEFGKISKWMLFRLIRKKELKRAVVISEALKHHYQEILGISDERILVAHDGADNPKNYSKITFSESNRMQIGYIGHLYPGKGMEIVSELSKTCPFADFHVIGGNDSDIAYWKGKTPNLNNLFFHGFLPPSQLDAYRQSFDILLAPYQKKVMILGVCDVAQWMSPLKIFEYMAAKKAIIASDLPVLREVLNESNAILIDPEDINGWTETIKRLQNTNLREKLANKAYEDFISKHTWAQRARIVIQNVLH